MALTPDQIGQQNAAEVFARRQAARASRQAALAAHPAPVQIRTMLATPALATPATASATTAGFLVAMGDSWFDYPLHDVLKLLDDQFGYNVESAAHAGDPLEAMVSPVGQLDKFGRCLDKVKAQGAIPKAALLSGGGDDIAGKEFGMLLNNATSAIAGWNSEILDGVINQRIKTAYLTMFAAIDSYCQKDGIATPPILVHGYGYPVPDGRGFLGGWPFPGPWLKPGFDEKEFEDLASNVTMMVTIIDEFNTMLAALAAANANVHYIDLRGTLSNALANDAYQQFWANELHPTEPGFADVAAKFDAVLKTLPQNTLP